jgi:hypothetical protein
VDRWPFVATSLPGFFGIAAAFQVRTEAFKPNQPTTVIHGKLKEAFMQGEEREAAELFREMLRQSVRAGLFEAMAEESRSS